MLTMQECHRLLVICSDHAVGQCASCAVGYRPDELWCDDLQGFGYCCPTCRADLSESARSHLATCTVIRALAEETRERAQATRQASVRLQKQGRQARDRASVLGIEAESARDKAARLRRQRPGEDR